MDSLGGVVTVTPVGSVTPLGSGAPALRVRARVRRGALDLDVDLDVDPGGTLAVLGPNGAGKTTLLHAVAGLVDRRCGTSEVSVAGQVWEGPGRRLPTQARSVGLLSAAPMLFPHLSVADNIAFGPRSRGARSAMARDRAGAELERLEIADLAERRPGQLSSGQAQRVALARALATDPQVLLLDEPLSALDLTTATVARTALAHRLADFPGVTVLVTHDPLDALTLADRLVFVEDGRVTQSGTPLEVVATPRSRYVASVVGLNLYAGHAGDGLTVGVAGPTGQVEVTTGGYAHRGDSWVAFAPRSVSLFEEAPHGSPRNGWPVTVAGVDLLGQHARVRLAGPIELVAEVLASSVVSMSLTPGRRVWASVKATEVSAYPR